MAIDPTQITTVNAEQLPVLPLQIDSIIMHSVDGVLYQATVSEIPPFIPSVNYQPYEVKQLNVTDLYIINNFDETGLGLPGGTWPGWAVINGNNGTAFDSDGCTFIGWGDVYSTMRQEVGENTKAITKNNIPPLDLRVPLTDGDNAGGSKIYFMTNDYDPQGEKTYTGVVNKTSTSTPLSIMQKSRVQLFIMKLP